MVTEELKIRYRKEEKKNRKREGEEHFTSVEGTRKEEREKVPIGRGKEKEGKIFYQTKGGWTKNKPVGDV